MYTPFVGGMERKVICMYACEWIMSGREGHARGLCR